MNQISINWTDAGYSYIVHNTPTANLNTYLNTISLRLLHSESNECIQSRLSSRKSGPLLHAVHELCMKVMKIHTVHHKHGTAQLQCMHRSFLIVHLNRFWWIHQAIRCKGSCNPSFLQQSWAKKHIWQNRRLTVRNPNWRNESVLWMSKSTMFVMHFPSF